MALNINIVQLSADLYQKGFFKNLKSVLDMGDQDINVNFEQLKKNLFFLNLKNFDQYFEAAKFYPRRPRVSSSSFWKLLGFDKTDRLDLIKLDRAKNDPLDNFFKVDLNFPIEKQVEIAQYDLVTDFGNNEHPFDVVESYKSMHKICKKNGFLLIQQALIGGNGFYNFDISFFENIAAVNNYSIVYSSLLFIKKNNFFSTPVDRSYYNMVNLNNIDGVEVVYIFKKNSDKQFVYPYQGSGKSISNNEYYINKFHTENLFPSRTYLPKSYNDLSLKTLIKFLLGKFFNRK
jgi:hypothetical protein